MSAPLRAAATARSTSSVRVTSATRAIAEAPISLVAASTADLSRSTSATRAPSATSRRAIASPIPRAPPVISATRPPRLIGCSSSFEARLGRRGPQPRDGLQRASLFFKDAPRPAGPQPRDGLQRALLRLRQCLVEVVDQVVGMLEPDRQAQQVLGCPRAGPLDRREVVDGAG